MLPAVILEANDIELHRKYIEALKTTNENSFYHHDISYDELLRQNFEGTDEEFRRAEQLCGRRIYES